MAPSIRTTTSVFAPAPEVLSDRQAEHHGGVLSSPGARAALESGAAARVTLGRLRPRIQPHRYHRRTQSHSPRRSAHGQEGASRLCTAVVDVPKLRNRDRVRVGVRALAADARDRAPATCLMRHIAAAAGRATRRSIGSAEPSHSRSRISGLTGRSHRLTAGHPRVRYMF